MRTTAVFALVPEGSPSISTGVSFRFRRRGRARERAAAPAHPPPGPATGRRARHHETGESSRPFQHIHSPRDERRQLSYALAPPEMSKRALASLTHGAEEAAARRTVLRAKPPPAVASPAAAAAAAAAGPRTATPAAHRVSLAAPDPTPLPAGVSRNATGDLCFADHPEFTPRLSPAQMIREGVFGGCYFHSLGGKPGVRSPQGVAIDFKEFPSAWFAGLPEKAYANRRYDAKRYSKYGVNCGQDQAAWETSNWIIPQDPRGWFQWFCRFYLGRRTADDKRQISRWTGVAGPKGRWKNALIKKVVTANAAFDHGGISPVIRQTLLHWAFELRASDIK